MQRIGALLVRRGAPLRQTSGSHHAGAAVPWCMLTAQRHLSAKLFVGGLSFRTEEDGLKNAFAVFGEVWDAKIIMDRETGKSRGFGFVTFENEADAETAISKMNGSTLDGRAIRVDRASARAPAPSLSTASSRPMGSFFDSSGTSSPSDFDSPGSDTPNSGAASGNASGVVSAFSDSSFGSASASNSSNSCSLLSSTMPGDSKPAEAPRRIILGSTDDDKPLSGDSKPAEAPRRIILGSMNDDTMPADSKPAEAPRRIILGSTGDTSASSSPTNSAGKFDFSDFSSLDNSSYQNDLSLPRRPRIRPVSTLPRPRIRTPLSNTNFDLNFPSSDSKFPFNTPSAPPKPKGPDFDFGLSDFPSTPPTIESGVRPHGAFDVDLPDDLPELPPEEPKPKPTGLALFPQRTLPPLDLPWDTPEADNWSEIGKDPPKFDDFSSPYSPLRSFIKKEKELFWDPYNYDEDAKLPPEYLSTEEEEEDLSLFL